MKKFCTYLGFVKVPDIEVTYPDNFDFIDNLDLKTQYLISLESQEASRLTAIESKTSQLIGFTGIIFSILSLFISNYLSKFSALPLILQILLAILLVISLLLYLLTIYHATKYLDIRKFAYGQRSTSTVKARYPADGFKIEQIKDMIYSIERNTQLTNIRSSGLIYGYRTFRLATVFVGILSLFVVFVGYFLPKPLTPTVIVEKPISVKGIDSETILRIEKAILMEKQQPVVIHDTVIIHK